MSKSKKSRAAGLKPREEMLVDGLSGIALELGRQLQSLTADKQLVRSVADLPDAQTRLSAVVEMTEAAAHRTLDLVENAQGHIAGLNDHPDPSVRQVADTIRADLLALSEAQAYQDLSGQMINRVSAILGGLQGALHELLDAAGVDWRQAQASDWDLPGPAAGVSEQVQAVSQGDADALIDGLGL